MIAPVDHVICSPDRIQSANALNRFICEKSESLNGMQFLASPLIGSAVSVSWIDQIFIKASSDDIEDVPARAWEILAAQGKRLIVDGRELTGAEENIAELRKLFGEFDRSKVSLLQSLRVSL